MAYKKPEMNQVEIKPTMYTCLPPSAQTNIVTGDPQEASGDTPVF